MNEQAKPVEEIKTRQIVRGGWSLPPLIELEVYKEALLIFYGKVSVYLKAMANRVSSSCRTGLPDVTIVTGDEPYNDDH